jgi:hypothetical protein
MSVSVAVRLAVSLPVLVTRGLGLEGRCHQTMLYYNITRLKADSRRLAFDPCTRT